MTALVLNSGILLMCCYKPAKITQSTAYIHTYIHTLYPVISFEANLKKAVDGVHISAIEGHG